jgi:demethylmenaquinone methyltransferase/2-methoxy-6-polyprenyl-1,4-benzoquinol methylase
MPRETHPTPRPRPLHEMFEAVPPRYDLVNRLVTLGLDSRWRRLAAAECLASSPARVLDLCCGTGDLAVALAELAGDRVAVTGYDFSPQMLSLAEEKASKRGRRVAFVCGDAAEMPFDDGQFDCVGISFGFRNLTWKNPLAARHLAEVLRIVRPGGQFVIVESSQPSSAFVRFFFHRYLRWFVGGLGASVSGQPAAYRYLAASAERFYSHTEVEDLLIDTGFSHVRYRPLLLGAAGIHVATR